ncbi:hypothetical protein OV079_37640 [Nannocystis pusilla]|uniref:Uncharacterized protein n=1 Tax=Nannocystis pusilla TaxID=889268 RepID=A0A9X3J012_9BACT|nr:hypothetical protein [Nannocystis pusilla]MCY1011187.1 hypothetical protein [Nannocystis pusilla]
MREDRRALGLGDQVDAVEREEQGGAAVTETAHGDQGVAQEGELGALEHLRGVEDEQQRVAAGQLAAADEGAQTEDVVDAGRVDQLELGRELLAGGGDDQRTLDRRLAARELGEALGCEDLGAGGAVQAALGGVAADQLDHRAGGRRDAGGQQRLAEERVDQGALALLDLPEHEHAQARLGEATRGLLEDLGAEARQAELVRGLAQAIGEVEEGGGNGVRRRARHYRSLSRVVRR